MVFNTMRTIYNLKLQTANLFGKKYKPLPNTTLNEKFGIYPNYDIDSEINPRLNLLTIGIGGQTVLDTSVTDLRKPRHSVKDGALFKHVPFIIRPVDNDLTDTERLKYRLRKLVTTPEQDYYFYYGRVIGDDLMYYDNIYKINSPVSTFNTGKYDTGLDGSILNPSPVIGNMMDTDNLSYLLNMCKIKFYLNDEEIESIKTAINILYPGENVSNITEIGVCSSLDIDVEYGKEAIWVQLNYFYDVDMDLQILFNLYNKNSNFILEVGGMEPLVVGS